MTTELIGEQLRRDLVLHNTLGGTETHFEPLDDMTVRMYLCGPTVYGSPHIGNMRMYLSVDIIRRVIRFAGYRLVDVMNITDVGHLTSDADTGDDKMAKAAAAERLTAWDVAAKYTKIFFDDTEQLNILPTENVLRATDHIKEQIALIRRLEDKGVVYRTDDGMYFDTSLVPDYGKLTPNDTREFLRAGERVAMGEKRHPTDFALWKFTPPDAPKRDMEWPSPWGVGFPGWHIECSAMAMAYLGDTLDIHAGGVDHIAVHHTNEIAQSETATGKPFSRWWMHGAFLILEGEKRMGKSVGNKIVLENLKEQGYAPLEFRYLALLSHYRSPLSFSETALDSAATAYRRLTYRAGTLRDEAAGTPPPESWQDSPYLRQFVEALAEDINTPRAVATMWNMLRDPEVDAPTKVALLEQFDEVLGLDLATATATHEAPAEIRELAERRWTLRQERKWAESDELRAELLAAGWTVQDERDGYQLLPARD